MSADNVAIANVILEQLGGARAFGLMTGAREYVAIENGIRFRLPSNFARGPHGCVNLITITLNGGDTYDLEFSRVRGRNVTRLSRRSDIYAEQLIDVVEQHTGLALRMPRITRAQ